MTDFGARGFATIEPGNGTLEEQIVFTGVTQNSNGTATLTGVSSVTFISPYTQTSGLAKTHAGSTTLVISNTAGFYDSLTGKADDETITGTWTFTNPNYPRMDVSTPFPTDNEQLATKAYADSLTFSGAPDATTSQKGIVQIATQAQVDAKTILGSTSATLVQPLNTQRSTLLSDYVLDTSTTPNIIILTPSPSITSYTAGQQFSFKAANANTGTSVVVNVSGLGAKNLVKLNGSTSLAASDIASGQAIIVEYDGTNFQMQSPVATAPLTSSVLKFGGTGADGALSVTSGVTTINLSSASIVVKNYTSITVSNTAVLNFSSPNTKGTIVILKASGNVVITSTSAIAVDGRGMGAAGGAGGTGSGGTTGGGGGGGSSMTTSGAAGTAGGSSSGNNGTIGSTFAATPYFTGQTGGGGGVDGGGPAAVPPTNFASSWPNLLKAYVLPGSGGGGGKGGGAGQSGGTGGTGGIALYIECAGALNFAGTIDASGNAGGNKTPSGSAGGGGGGGGSGSVVILYNTLTANTGTITTSGGAAGTSDANGGAGAAGYSLVALNSDFA